MKYPRTALLTGLLATLISTGCSEDIESRAEEKLKDVGKLPSQEILFVNDQKVPCTGVAPMQCLQVRTDNNQPWQLFYTNIQGFEFVPGIRYELLVDVERIENPPQDASALRYQLIKVIAEIPSETAKP